MQTLRDEIKIAESDPSRITEILKRYQPVEEFINLYLKRNPTYKLQEFVEFYENLDVSSQVILYEKTNKMIESHDFERECILKYCVEEQSNLFYNIIKGVRCRNTLFQILGDFFSQSIYTDVGTDLFATKCLIFALSVHEIECEHMSTVISATGMHLCDSRRIYYEHGMIVANALFKTAHFDIDSFDETKRIIDYIPSETLKKRHQSEFKNLNDTFELYTKIENDLHQLKSKWKPKYLQEAIKVILEEKDANKIEGTFRNFSELVYNATDRTIKLKSKEALDALLRYDGCEEHKIEAVYSLVTKSFDVIVNEVIDNFFNHGLCIRSKVVLMFVFRKVFEHGPYSYAKFLHENICFMSKRHLYEMPGILKDGVEDLILYGVERLSAPDSQ